MSASNVDNFWTAFDAYMRRDADAFCALCDPAVESYPVTTAVEGGYTGHDGIREWFARLDATMRDISLEVHDVRDLGDRMIALGHFRAVGKGSGASVDTPIGWVVELDDGRVVRWWTYPDHARALAAVGLEEIAG